MRSFFLLAFAAVFATALSAQTSSTFFSTFDAERGNLVVPARDGNLWLGGQKDERVLLTKLNTEGKALDRHSIGFEGAGLDLEHLTDLFEETDGTLVGCGNFEQDNLGRGFVFRYNPATRQVVWAHTVRSGNLNFLLGITRLGPGGDYVLYGNVHFTGGEDAELIQLNRTTGLIVPGKTKRLGLGSSDRLNRLVFHDGALYAGGHFTIGNGGFARIRNAICKIDTATLEPVWSRTGPVPANTLARLEGRDLIVEEGALISTFCGNLTDPFLQTATMFLQKNDLSGNLLWTKQYDLPEWRGDFAEEIITLPDGYLLYGHDLLSDTSRLFLLKTDKDGNAQWAKKIVYDYNDEFPDIPARSKILRLGDALFFTALSQNNVGQTQGILVKTDLNGSISDSCDYLQPVAVFPVQMPPPVSEAVVPTVSAGTATQTTATVSVSLPDLTFSKKCGATGTCPGLPDLRLTLDSIVCKDGDPRLYYTICNVGGQPYDGPYALLLYDKNPFAGPAKLITGTIGGGLPVQPGECSLWASFGSDPYYQTPFELDTFSRIYALIGASFAVQPPIPVNGFPYPPNRPECSYLNNLDSISIPKQLCGGCENPITFVKKLGAPQRRELAFSMCAASDGNVYVAGKQGDNPMIAKVTTRGEQLWVRNFPPIHPNEPIEWAQIIEDSDGMLVLCGTEGGSPSNRRAIAMRYDPVAGAVLWYKRYQSSKPVGVAIVEKSPGGNFVLQTNFQSVGSGGVSAQTEYFTLNRADGNTTGSSVSYQSQSHNIVIANTVLNNGKLFAVGSWSDKSADAIQPFFAKISPSTFLPEWANITVSDTSSGAGVWMTPADVAFDGDIPVIVGAGHRSPFSTSEDIFVFLEKHNPDGSLQWMKRYNMRMAPEEVLTFPNAYIVFGRMVGTNQFGMLKTDVHGNVLQARVLTAAPTSPVSVGITARQNLILSLPLQILMLDHTWEPDESDLVFVRTDLNFGLDDACDRMQSVQVNSQTLTALTEQAQFGIGTNTPASAALPASAVFQADSLPVSKLCPDCCTDKPDITFQIESVGCDSAAFVRYRLCNTGGQPFSGPLNIGVYDSNPLTNAATLLDQFSLQIDNLQPDSCQTGTLINLAYWGNYSKVFTLAGIESGQTTPVDPNGFPYNGIAECDYANNLDSLDFQYPPPLPFDLGPNTAICPGDTLLLGAGLNGFVSYTWQDGSTGPTYPVVGEGLFSLSTRDGCGRMASDNIVVSLKNQPKATREIVLLPGDSVVIGGVVYKSSAQVISYTPSTTGGCDTLVTNNIRLDSLHCDRPGSFFKTFAGVNGRVVTPAADGGYYVGGSAIGHALHRFDATGKNLWVRSFDFFGNSFIQTLIEDSEGMLVGSATSEGGTPTILVFRYNPVSDQMLWVRRHSSAQQNIRGYEVVEINSGGDFLLSYVRWLSTTDFNTHLITFDRNTGDVAKAWRYETRVALASMAIHQGAIYASGLLRDTSVSSLFLWRAGLMKIDLNTGIPAWSRLSTTPGADLLDGDLIVDGDGNIVSTLAQSGTGVWLQKTAPNGDLLWLKKIEVNDPNEHFFSPLGLVLTNDGYGIGIQTYSDSTQRHSYVVIKTDKNGNLLWAKKVSKVGGSFTVSPHQLASRGNEICFTTNLHQQIFQFTGMVLGKFDKLGNLGETCGLAENVPVTITAQPGNLPPAFVQFTGGIGEFDPHANTPSLPSSTLQNTLCSKCLPPCDSIFLQQTIQFYPGDTVFLAGTPYTQPDTVTLTLTAANGCDSVVTYYLQRVITTIDLVCPPDQTVNIPANQTSATVSYPQPAAATDCPITGITLTRLQGPAPGGLFPVGTTLVCYEAANRCGIRDTCCFSVTVQKVTDETACDVKIPPGSCIKYEILSIRLDSLGRPRYRMRLTNTCASPLRFAYFQIPDGMTAKAPLEGATYTAPSGNTYLVRNPNAAPYRSIRFKPLSGTLNNGKSDIFEYTLPKQAQMAFVLVSAKLEDGSSSEAHVNTFACPVQPYVASAQEPAAQERSTPPAATTEVFVRPNPTSGLLFVEITGKQAQAARIQVLNAQGQLVLEGEYASGSALQLPENLANGLYFLLVQPADGSARAAVRFVLER